MLLRKLLDLVWQCLDLRLALVEDYRNTFYPQPKRKRKKNFLKNLTRRLINSERKHQKFEQRLFSIICYNALYLRRHIWISSTFFSDCKGDNFAQTEVWQLQVAIWVYQNIFRFWISDEISWKKLLSLIFSVHHFTSGQTRFTSIFLL